MSKASASRIARHKRRFRHRSTIGTIPGTLLVHETSQRTAVRVIQYDEHVASEVQVDSLPKLRKLLANAETKLTANRRSGVAWNFGAGRKHSGVTWINVDGLSDTKLIKQIGDLLNLHSLALEDAVNVHQRAKFEPYAENLFFVVRVPADESVFHTEQVSLFLCGNVVLTLQERGGDSLKLVRERISNGLGRIRSDEADYLTYAIIDAIVDGYFSALEGYGNALDEITTQLGGRDNQSVPLRLHEIRGSLLNMRRVVRQHRDALQQLLREPRAAISEDTKLYFRDCLDHINQLLDATDAERETCAELRELYFAMLGQRNNDVIKVLTIVSTIFIPMSFIASVYGMNFEPGVSRWNMPELNWTYGYPLALGAMATVAGGLLWYLNRKGWLS